MFTFVPMSTAIVLMAFGKKEYYQMAYNMALSIRRFNNDIPIHLIHDDKYSLPDYKSWVFSIRTPIDERDLYQNGLFSPGMAKLNIDRYLVHNVNIYLDVDGICLRSLDEIINKANALKGCFYAQKAQGFRGQDTIPMGNYKRDGNEFPEMQWATLEKIWQYHEIGEDALVPAINSSFLVLRKGNNLSAFYEQARENAKNGVPLSELSMPWGNTYPDELALNVACGQLGINPDFGGYPIMFAHQSVSKEVIYNAEKNHWFLGLYGGKGFTSSTMWEFADKKLMDYHRHLGLTHEYKWHKMSAAKHANKSRLLAEGRPPR